MNWIKTALIAGALLAMSAVAKGTTVSDNITTDRSGDAVTSEPFTTAAPSTIDGVQFTGPVTNISGLAAGYTGFPTQQEAINLRPVSTTDQTLVLENLYIHDLVNQKALSVKNSAEEAYSNVLLENILIQNVTRNSAGVMSDGTAVHTDFIRIQGNNTQDNPTNVTLDNVHINNGASLPILVTDGIFHDLVFNDVSITNTTLQEIQIDTTQVGHVDHIYIENSPDLRMALLGRAGSIGDVTIFNSPGAVVGDLNVTGTGASGAKIIYDTTAPTIDDMFGSGLDLAPSSSDPLVSDGPVLAGVGNPAPVPEPTSLSLLGVVGFFATRRTRKA